MKYVNFVYIIAHKTWIQGIAIKNMRAAQHAKQYWAKRVVPLGGETGGRWNWVEGEGREKERARV